MESSDFRRQVVHECENCKMTLPREQVAMRVTIQKYNRKLYRSKFLWLSFVCQAVHFLFTNINGILAYARRCSLRLHRNFQKCVSSRYKLVLRGQRKEKGSVQQLKQTEKREENCILALPSQVVQKFSFSLPRRNKAKDRIKALETYFASCPGQIIGARRNVCELMLMIDTCHVTGEIWTNNPQKPQFKRFSIQWSLEFDCCHACQTCDQNRLVLLRRGGG